MEEIIHPSKYSMMETCSLRPIDTKISKVEGSQGIKKTLTLIEERKSSISPIKHKVDAVMK
jgi:hypothetical protein